MPARVDPPRSRSDAMPPYTRIKSAVLAALIDGQRNRLRNEAAWREEAPLSGASLISAQGLGSIRLGSSRRSAERILHVKLEISRSQDPDGECSTAVRADGRDEKILLF